MKFILIGLAFAFMGEALTCFFIKLSAGSFVFAIVLYGVILYFAYLVDKLVDRIIKQKAIADVVYFLVVGFIGLMSEWAIGNTPWNSPQASQFSMFMYHVTTYFMPRLFLDQRAWVSKIKKRILQYFIPYFVVVLIIGFILPQSYRLFWLVVLTFYIGYNVLLVFYLWYFVKNFRVSSQPDG